MVSLSSLWLPILLSALGVFFASSILHMVLRHHQSDYGQLPEEEAVLEFLRTRGIEPGDYAFPRPKSQKDLSSPEMVEKLNRGPVGLITVLQNGPPVMGKHLCQWFVLCLVISVFVAYLTGRTVAPGADYLAVFRIAGTAALLGYAGDQASNSIWKGQAWSTSFKMIVDGLVYALVTAAIFAWLWP